MAASLEERITELETKVERLQQKHDVESPQDTRPWWEQIRGTFKEDAAYDEAMRLGREYRESLRPTDGEDI